MTSVAKIVPPERTQLGRIPLSTFPENSYSHGLETIYTIETIDIKTVRPMMLQQDEPTPNSSNNEFEEEVQLNLDLGNMFRNWMPPYTFEEPIQILDLGKHIEKILLEKGLCTLGSLESANFKEIAIAKGLGQGHIEDIRRKLKDYLICRPRHRTSHIDFLSLLKCLFGNQDRRKLVVALEPYNLHQWIILSPLEKIEIKKLTVDERAAWSSEIFSTLNQNWLNSQWHIITDTWIKPWLLNRQGFAKQYEIEEMLVLRSSDEKSALQALAFLQSYISLSQFLHCFEDIYTISPDFLNLARQVIDTSSTYLFKPSITYSLETLVLFIHSEFALKWQNIMPAIINKLLRMSSRFHTFRHPETGIWMISSK